MRGIASALALALAIVALTGVDGHTDLHHAHANLLLQAKTDPDAAFRSWLSIHRKAAITDYAKRFDIFLSNVHYILEYNLKHDSHKLTLNEYADISWEEFSRTRLGLQLSSNQTKSARIPGFIHEETVAPAAIDWREKGAVAPVKDQGACGSCWAFSTTGSIEGINAIKTGEIIELSEQELVDCDREYNAGCGGGLMDYAYEYIVKNGGIDTEADYAYWSYMGLPFSWCNKRKQKERTVVTIDGYQDVPTNEAALQKAVANQPVAVAICASQAMQFYHGGVIDTCCEELNHGVLAVGYGSEANGGPYWIVKNSWGGAWGEQGYFKLAMGKGDMGLCGIASAASYPVKEHPNPQVPEMCDVFGWQECPSGSSCSCTLSFFGWFCIRSDCCPLKDGVTCSDGKHCCPGDAPVCDTASGTCSSEDGKTQLPWADKFKANASRPPAARPASTQDDADLPAAN